MEVGSLIDLEDAAIMSYAINGIKDDERNKVILYGACDLDEFKIKLNLYEKFVANLKNSKPHNSFKVEKPRNEERKDRSCYNCKKSGHIARDCPEPKKNSKCFNCGEEGHISRNCKKPRKESSNMGFLFPRMIKEVQISTGTKCMKLNALVDTGSELTAVKESIFEQCGESLTPTGMSMNGLGKKIVESLGTFESEIVIDDVKLCSKCYVLPDSALNFDMILGLDVIMQAKLEVSRSGVKIIPTVVENNFGEVNEEISCL